MSLLAVPGVQAGRPTCPLGCSRLLTTPASTPTRLGGLLPGRGPYRRLLLPALPGRKVGVHVFAASPQQHRAGSKGSPSLLATLPQWCHRLTGAFVLVPFLLFGGSKQAVAQPLSHPSLGAFSAAAVRPNPLFEASSADMRDSAQFRAAAAVATAMVGYGFVRSTSGGARILGGGGGGRGVAMGAAAGTTTLADTLPSSTEERQQRLDQIYVEVEDLKTRNSLLLWRIETDETKPEAGDSDSTDGSTDGSAAGDGPMLRPSGGASRLQPTVSVLVSDVTATAAASVAAATEAAAAAAGVPVRPSGGASRLASPATGSVDGMPSTAFLYDTLVPPVPIPERPGGASSRSGPTAPPLQPSSPPDSSRVRAQDEASPSASPSASAAANLAAWAGEVLEQTAAASPSSSPAASPRSPGANGNGNGNGSSRSTGAGPVRGNGHVARLSAKFESALKAPVAEPPVPSSSGPASSSSPPAPASTSGGGSTGPQATETLRPSLRPTRRASGAGAARQQRTYRAIPPTPTRSNPSFDVPEGAPSPQDYLREIDGRTADGRLNPSFAPVKPVSGGSSGSSSPSDVQLVAAPEAQLVAPPAVSPGEQVAAAAIAPSTAPVTVGEPEVPVASSFEAVPPAASEAMEAAAPPSPTLQVPPPPPPPPAVAASAAAVEQPQVVWYNPLSWFAQPVEEAVERPLSRNPSFDASLAIVDAPSSAVDAPLEVVNTPLTVADTPLTVAVIEPAAAELAAAAEVLPVSVVESLALEAQAAEVPMVSLVESLVRDAEVQAAEGVSGGGVGAAAADAAASWSEALTEGAAPGDFGPVERVAELLEVAMKTEEFAAPKYNPIREEIADATAPSPAHKYDMLRGLLRTGKEEEQAAAAESSSVGEVEAVPAAAKAAVKPRRVHKYDLVYDLLQSLRTSGDPAVILAASDPKYDPVWALLNMKAPTPGSLSKYDLVGSMLQAALAASPQPSPYDPLQALLQIKPATGRSKYCLAQVLLNGGWQQPLESGLEELPPWDPLASAVGGAAAEQRKRPTRSRRTVSKYDMVGQALEAAASLPEELASGKWAAAQPRDPLLGPRSRTAAPRIRSPRSKYDMVGQALDAAASLPEELASGKWAAAQGRELVLDTANKALDEGGWGFVRRLRRGGSVVINAGVGAVKVVTAVTAPVGNMIAKAAGMPYEVAPGVVVKVSKPRSPSPARPPIVAAEAAAAAAATAAAAVLPSAITSAAESRVAADSAAAAPPAGQAAPAAPAPARRGQEDEELPTVLFQFKEVQGNPKPKKAAAVQQQVTVTAKRPRGPAQRGVAPPPPAKPAVTDPEAAAAGAASAAAAAPAAAPRPERAVVPPGRGRRSVPASLPYVDRDALLAALESADVEGPRSFPAGRQAEGKAEVSTVSTAAVTTTTAAAAAASPVEVPSPAAAAAAAAEPPAPTAPAPTIASTTDATDSLPATLPSDASAAAVTPLSLSELAMDLMVATSMQRAGGEVPPPSLDELVQRFGAGFADVAKQLRLLRADEDLLYDHPAVARVIRTASSAPAGAQGMFSQLYNMLDAVRDAEAALPAFLVDCSTPYPLVHGLLKAGDVGQGVSVLCTLCNLVPNAAAAAPQATVQPAPPSQPQPQAKREGVSSIPPDPWAT